MFFSAQFGHPNQAAYAAFFVSQKAIMKLNLYLIFAAVIAAVGFGAQAAGVDVAALIAANPDLAVALSGFGMMGAIRTLGTDLFAIDPRDNSLITVGCVTSVDGVDASIEQIETTCLNAGKDRQYMSGMGTPGAATFGINTDTADESHLKLYQLKQLGLTLKWVIGWGDGPQEADGTIVLPPTITDTDFVLPDGRSWLLFQGYLSSFPFNFALNSVVTSTVGIQISGTQVLIPKGGDGGGTPGAGRPLFFNGPVDAHTSGTDAFLAGATAFGSAGSKVGSISVQTTTGNYGWIAMPGAASASGVTFRDPTNTPSDWNGAGNAGPNTGNSPVPAQSSVTVTYNGVVYRLFRMDYPNSQPTAATWTTA